MTYATLVFASVITLSLIGVETLDIYSVLSVILFFVAAELTPFSPRNSRKKAILEVVLVAIFAVIVIERIVGILT